MEETNTTIEVPIDTAEEVARFRIDSGKHRRAETVALHLEGTETASYRIEFGENTETDSVRWFAVDGDYEYTDATSIDDSWRQPEAYLRIVVTSAATSGATADVAVSRGI